MDDSLRDELRELYRLLGSIRGEINNIGDGYRDTTESSNRLSRSAYNYLNSVKKAYNVQKNMKSGIKGLVTGLGKMAELNEEILFLQKEALKVDGEKRKAIEEEIEKLKITLKFYRMQYDSVSKTKLALKESVKFLNKVPDLVERGFNRIKNSGIFEMDKAIKTTSLSMGLLGNRSQEFYSNILDVNASLTSVGITVQDLAKIQEVYSDELGRSVILSEKGLEAMSYMAKGTGLGAEAAAKMAAEFDSQGLSVEKTATFMEQTMNDASSMGLNASKVTKNIQNNIKLLNRYNFKEGVKGLAKMAETVTKLGIDMNAVAPMADKLFNIDGAVEMSAQLQVLGGKWSQLADPFKLMYQARNDMDALVKSIGEAAAESASLDKDGNIKMSSLEMARLRQVAETTGVAYDELAEAAKRAAKASFIKGKISLSGLNEEDKDFLTNIAQIENGEAYVYLNGDKKLLSSLDFSNQQLIKSMRDEKASLKERAEQAMSFDEQVKSIVDMVKQAFLPLAKDLADPKKGLAKSLNEFRDWLIKENIVQGIQNFAKGVASVVSTIGNFLGPKGFVGLLAGWGALKVATWIANGYALAKGFRAGAKISLDNDGRLIDDIIDEGTDGPSSGRRGGRGRLGKIGKGIKGFGRAAFPFALASAGFDAYQNFTDNSLDKGEAALKTLDENKFMALGAGIGALFGGVGAIPGAGIGAVIDWIASLSLGDKALIGNNVGKGYGVDDGIVFNPKDKFMKVNDSTMIAGTNVDGNKSLAKALMATQVVPGMQTSSLPSEIKLSDLNISGTIELKLNGESSSEIGKQLLNDPIFIRNLSRMVNMATASAISGSQPQKPLK